MTHVAHARLPSCRLLDTPTEEERAGHSASYAARVELDGRELWVDLDAITEPGQHPDDALDLHIGRVEDTDEEPVMMTVLQRLLVVDAVLPAVRDLEVAVYERHIELQHEADRDDAAARLGEYLADIRGGVL